MRDRNKSLDLMNDIDTSYKFRLPQNVIFNLYIFKTYIIYIYIYILQPTKRSHPLPTLLLEMIIIIINAMLDLHLVRSVVSILYTTAVVFPYGLFSQM